MKTVFHFAILLLVFDLNTIQPNPNNPLHTGTCSIQEETPVSVLTIDFKLKNNSILPTKLTVISYQPNQTGNGTQAFYLLPYASKRFTFPEGTKIFLANQNQVNTVMSGGSLASQSPFLLVTKSLQGQAVPIKK
jgi:hypothetical protein